MADRGNRIAIAQSVDYVQRYGVDADVERQADALLGERALHGQQSDTVSLDALTDAVSETLYGIEREAETCGVCGGTHAHHESTRAEVLQREAPLGVAHVRTRLRWPAWGYTFAGRTYDSPPSEARGWWTTLGQYQIETLLRLAEPVLSVNPITGERTIGHNLGLFASYVARLFEPAAPLSYVASVQARNARQRTRDAAALRKRAQRAREASMSPASVLARIITRDEANAMVTTTRVDGSAVVVMSEGWAARVG